MMKHKISHIFHNWIVAVSNKIKERPEENIAILIVSIALIFFLSREIYSMYGIIPVAGYLSVCAYRIIFIIDNPRLLLAWAVGYIIGAMAVQNVLIEMFIPSLKEWNIVSIISALIILIVFVRFYLKSKELKSHR